MILLQNKILKNKKINHNNNLMLWLRQEQKNGIGYLTKRKTGIYRIDMENNKKSSTV